MRSKKAMIGKLHEVLLNAFIKEARAPFWIYLRYNKHRASIKFDDANQMATRFLLSSLQVSILFFSFRIFSNQLLLPPPSATCYNESSGFSLRFCNFPFYFFCKTKDHLSFLMGFSLLIKLMGYWKEQSDYSLFFRKRLTTGNRSSTIGRQVALVRCCRGDCSPHTTNTCLC